MSLHALMSYLSQVRWSADIHWYFSHLDVSRLIDAWQRGRPFTQDDWLTVAAMGASLSVLLLLVGLLVVSYRNTLFRAWLDHKRSQLSHRPPRESRTRLEPKVNGHPMLQQVYNLHRLGMYDNALNKYRMALQSNPFDLNTYLVGVKIVSEMEIPHQAFVQHLIEAMSNLRDKHPAVWNELVRYGRETAPTLVQWQTEEGRREPSVPVPGDLPHPQAH